MGKFLLACILTSGLLAGCFLLIVWQPTDKIRTSIFGMEPELATSVQAHGFRSCVPPSFANAGSYNQARSIITEADFQPREAEAGDDCHPENSRFESSYCADYPEVRSCSGTGLGFCRIEFEHQSGDELVITTAGGYPSPHNDEVGVYWASISCPLWDNERYDPQ